MIGMETGSYKVHAKIGQAEFDAEGDRDSVRQDYDKFLRAVESRTTEGLSNPGNGDSGAKEQVEGKDIDDAFLQAVFKTDVENGVISLKVLPPSESSNRAADAALIVLFGFHKVLGQ